MCSRTSSFHSNELQKWQGFVEMTNPTACLPSEISGLEECPFRRLLFKFNYLNTVYAGGIKDTEGRYGTLVSPPPPQSPHHPVTLPRGTTIASFCVPFWRYFMCNTSLPLSLYIYTPTHPISLNVNGNIPCSLSVPCLFHLEKHLALIPYELI